MNCISVVIPIYNEKDNILILLKKIIKSLKKKIFEILIIDDNSNDGSFEVYSKVYKNDRRIKYIVRKEKKKDLSKSCQIGFDRSKYNIILVMDGDLQHDPIYIEKLLKTLIRTKSDIVIGVRDLKKDKLKILDHNVIRLFFSKLLIVIINIMLGYKTNDPMSGYFIFKKKIYLKNKNNLFLKGYKILADLLYNSKDKIIIKDYLIDFNKRVSGSSKMSYKVLFALIEFILITYFKKIFLKLCTVKKNKY
jgi:dolichol-phosphate mannosyltransferase